MRLSQCPVLQKINGFLTSPLYIVSLLILSIAAHLLALELVAYTVFAAIAVYICFISNDFLPAAPLFLFGYILPSAQNNPGKNEASLFSSPWFFALAATVILCLTVFVIRNFKKILSCKGKLLWGMLAVLASYLLSGIGSSAYGSVASKNLLFAAAQGLCLLLPYLLLAAGTDWSKLRRDYLSWIGVCAGILLLVEIFWSYHSGGVITDGVIDRKKIFTGWGMYNNLGAMLGMMIPFCFSLGVHHKKGWLGTILGFVFLVGTVMTCSRTSMVAALGIYAVCLLIFLLSGTNRKRALWSIGGLFALVLIALVVFREPIFRLYSAFLGKITDPSSRHILFAEGWKQFLEAPIFGSSFYSPGYQPWDFSTVDSFSAAFPPRWHNTFIQLLASCGVVGFIAYLWHRVQTIRLFFRIKGTHRLFLGCSILVLLGCSLLDCHFFNIGPVLFYSLQLAFLEFGTTEE